jgi:hypothetical protein
VAHWQASAADLGQRGLGVALITELLLFFCVPPRARSFPSTTASFRFSLLSTSLPRLLLSVANSTVALPLELGHSGTSSGSRPVEHNIPGWCGAVRGAAAVDLSSTLGNERIPLPTCSTRTLARRSLLSLTRVDHRRSSSSKLSWPNTRVRDFESIEA